MKAYEFLSGEIIDYDFPAEKVKVALSPKIKWSILTNVCDYQNFRWIRFW